MALEDTLWREDVIDQEEVARDSGKVLDDWIRRLAYQGAPPQLIQHMTGIRDLYSQVYQMLGAVKQCFPSPHEKRYHLP